MKKKVLSSPQGAPASIVDVLEHGLSGILSGRALLSYV
jgi:hypothetical protein